MTGLRLETLRSRIVDNAMKLAAADSEARACWHDYGPHDVETKLAQRRRRELRDRVIGLAANLQRRLAAERNGQ